MGQDDYVDLMKRITGLGEALVETTALLGSVCGLLVAKHICTYEEIAETKQAYYELESMKQLTQIMDRLKTQIDELEKAGSRDLGDLFTDFFDKKGE